MTSKILHEVKLALIDGAYFLVAGEGDVKLSLAQIATSATKEELDILHGALINTAELNRLDGLTGDLVTLLAGKAAVLTQATPVNAVAAKGTLTLSGVAIDGETITIGEDVYEFAADTALSVAAGNIVIDITAVTTKAVGTLTIAAQPTAGDTMTIGAKTYTFVPNGTANANGEVSVGTDLATAKEAILAAINGTDSHNTANASVVAAAFVANVTTLTAIVGGAAGNAIVTTQTFTAGTNVFNGVTLGTTTPGVDCTAANAVTAIVAAITASATEPISAVDGAGDTVVVTADVKGILANAIATTETCANAAWGAVTLAGGVDGTVSAGAGIWHYDATYLYLSNAANTVADANWRRIALGAAY